MLHQFIFKNYKTFKEEVVLDLLASPIKEHQKDVVLDCFDERVLKVAAVYGANASGKSNLINAFRAMKSLVLNSFSNRNYGIKIEPYWFEEEDVPTEFTVIFSNKENIYQYGFVILNNEILEESLYKRDKESKSEKFDIVFEREKQNVIFTETIEELKITETFLKLVKNDTLYLSVLSEIDIKEVEEVIDWFKNTETIDYGNPNKEMIGLYTLSGFGNVYKKNTENNLISIIEDPIEKIKLEKFIKAIDVGIEELGVIEELFEKGEDETSRKRIVSYHKNPKTNKLVSSPITSESSGTIKMLLLYVDISSSLKEGYTLFIDELDAKLHPLLLRYIIIMFHSSELNKKNAQLIFSTQEVFTLDKENLRRDEIWFADKNEFGESELTSLDSYVDSEGKKVRNDASYAKDYILGRYNSIPNLKKLEDDFNG